MSRTRPYEHIEKTDWENVPSHDDPLSTARGTLIAIGICAVAYGLILTGWLAS